MTFNELSIKRKQYKTTTADDDINFNTEYFL